MFLNLLACKVVARFLGYFRDIHVRVVELKGGARRATISDVKEKGLPQNVENSKLFAKQTLDLYNALAT